MKRHLPMFVVAWWPCAVPVAGQTSWDYVQALAPGTPVVVAARGELPVNREVVSVDADVPMSRCPDGADGAVV